MTAKRRVILVIVALLIIIAVFCMGIEVGKYRKQPTHETTAEELSITELTDSGETSSASEKMPDIREDMLARLTSYGTSESDEGESNPAESESETSEEKENDRAQVSGTEPSSIQNSRSETEPTTAPVLTGNPYSCTGLHVSGTKLVNENGETVQLKGISTHGIAWYPQYVNQQLFTELHDDFGMNVIRLSMYTAENVGYCTGGDQSALKQLIDNGVNYASNAGMYVIIDWHILSDGNPNTYLSQAVQFFSETARKYASHSNVIYEICNEPNGGTSWSEIRSYAVEVINAIRKYDDAPIIVGTPNWSQYLMDAAADPLPDSNILYALHFYSGTHKDDLRNTLISALNSGLPVFVSEFGVCDASGNGGLDTAEADKWVSVMNQYGVSYCNWSLSNKAESASFINASCTKTSGLTTDDLTESGKWLVKTLTGKTAVSAPETETKVPESGTAAETQAVSEAAKASESANAENILTDEELIKTVNKVNEWDNGDYHYEQYLCSIQNVSDSTGTGWKITIGISGLISIENGWNGIFSVSGDAVIVTSADYNGTLMPGGQAGDIGFIVKKSRI